MKSQRFIEMFAFCEKTPIFTIFVALSKIVLVVLMLGTQMAHRWKGLETSFLDISKLCE